MGGGVNGVKEKSKTICNGSKKGEEIRDFFLVVNEKKFDYRTVISLTFIRAIFFHNFR